MIDRNQVMIHYRRGCLREEIAARMQCSTKQVGRIIRAGITPLDKVLHDAAKDGTDYAVWLTMLTVGYSIQETAEYVGISRETLYNLYQEYQTQEQCYEESREISEPGL